MSRLSKFLLVIVVVVFILACNFVTQPIKDVQNIAGTAQSFATALPVETLKALTTQVPIQTLKALPSALPDVEKFFNPQGTPVETWKDIPIMPQATAGQEFNDSTYSFKINVTAKEVQDFYKDKLAALSWNQTFSLPGETDSAIMVFQKESSFLTIT